MQAAFKIIPPKDTTETDIASIGSELKGMSGIEGAGSTQSRAIDPVSLLVWVKLSAEVAAVAGAAVKVLEDIVKFLRDRGMGAATIEFADGTKLSIANASIDDIRKLVDLVKD